MQLTLWFWLSSLRYRRVSALYAYQLRCSRPDLKEVSDEDSIIDEDCPRGPLAGRKALHTSFHCSVDEVLLGDACWILLSANEREHSVHSVQDSRQLLRVLVICLDPSDTLGSQASRSILNRAISCNDSAIHTRADNMRTFRDKSKISCFLAATRTSIISCATSAELLATLWIRFSLEKLTAGGACDSNPDHFSLNRQCICCVSYEYFFEVNRVEQRSLNTNV